MFHCRTPQTSVSALPKRQQHRKVVDISEVIDTGQTHIASDVTDHQNVCDDLSGEVNGLISTRRAEDKKSNL